MPRGWVVGLVLLLAGGLGWYAYEHERSESVTPRPETAPGPERPATDQAPDQAPAPPVSKGLAGAASAPPAAADRDMAPAAPQREPDAVAGGGQGASPERVAPEPTPSAGVEGQTALESGNTARALPALSLEQVKRTLSVLLGGEDELSKEAMLAPGTGVGQRDLAPARVLYPLPQTPKVVRPSFDLVQISRDGRAVIAGRAEPGAKVEIRAGERVIDRVVASRRGEWVSVPSEPLRAGELELSLAAQAQDGEQILSEQAVVVAVAPAPFPGPTAVAATETPAASMPAAATPATDEPIALLVRKDGQGSGRVLQAPGRIDSSDGLALMMLDYDDTGRIRLSGEAQPGAPLRIYVDNDPAGEVVVPADGTWRSILGGRLSPGNYTLRLDQLDADGKPVARLETPFTRASQPPVEGALEVDYVVVQPGNSLWRIARRLLGRGFEYVHIYAANESQIRNPDLIYPGQVFEVPSGMAPQG